MKDSHRQQLRKRYWLTEEGYRAIGKEPSGTVPELDRYRLTEKGIKMLEEARASSES